MKITERQAEILNSVVETYIKSAEPVSSKFLEEKYKFGICPATIRIEMQKLTEEGFIFQPHTSAGRLPTDKGYRFFVDDLLKRELLEENLDFEVEDWIEKEVTDSIKILQSITKNLASTSSNLALGYLPDLKIFWKEGWEEIIKEPEFEEKKVIDDFTEMIKGFEEEIEDLKISFDIKVYIGKESPFRKAKEFSTIVTKCHFSEKENGILAILGPKRMDYNRNIGSLNSLIRLLEKI
ncbi:MAG: hypothetical protein Q8M00_00950 [bacterium]|nr:hypothetical protein [bacterium]